MEQIPSDFGKGFPRHIKQSIKNNQQHQLISNVNSSMPKQNRNLYNTVITNRTRTLTTLSPLETSTNGAYRYEGIWHSMPENNTYVGNECSSHHTYQGLQNRIHNYHTSPFTVSMSSHRDCDQENFHNRGVIQVRKLVS